MYNFLVKMNILFIYYKNNNLFLLKKIDIRHFFVFNRSVSSGETMQKNTDMKEKTGSSSRASSKQKEINEIEVTTEITVITTLENNDTKTPKATKRSTSKKSITETHQDNFDKKHSITNQFREETASEHRPPKGSLSELVFLNKLEILENKLLSGNINPNERDEVGVTCSWTPLYWAVKLMKYEAVKILIENGANINIVVNDCEECCGTVLDLATLRGDDSMEILLREFGEKEDVEFGQSFKAIRTKLRGKAPAFNFRYYGKKKMEEAA
jgi:hypothetical protein